jgi:Flp pilus assembly protein CpaB
MRRRRSTMLLLGAIFALLAFFVLYISLSRPTTGAVINPTPTPEPTVQAIITNKDIPSYTIVKKEDLSTLDIKVSTVTSDTVQDATKVIGQVLTKPYLKGQQIAAGDISQPGISLVLTKGQHGFDLPILEVDNFGGQLNDNDVVDILWSRNFEVVQAIVGADGKPAEHIEQLPTTKKLLDNIKVVRVIHLVAGQQKQSNAPVQAPQEQPSGDAAAQQQAQTQANQGLYAKDAPPSAVLVLAVTDQQAEVIKFARENGIVSLTLRAKDDTDVERTTGITDKIMNEDYGVVLPEILIK